VLLVGWSRDRFPVVSLDFSVTYFLPTVPWPWGPSENEYQEHFLGVKAAGAWGWPHHLCVPNVMKSGSLNLLEPSGPHRACYGTAFPISFFFSTLHSSVQCVQSNSTLHSSVQCVHSNSTLHSSVQCVHSNSTLHSSVQCVQSNSTLHSSVQCVHSNSTLHILSLWVCTFQLWVLSILINFRNFYYYILILGGKQWQTTPKNLPRMQHTICLTELWSLPRPAQGLNTYNNNNSHTSNNFCRTQQLLDNNEWRSPNNVWMQKQNNIF
jgi:hypothetical protein